MQTYDLDAYLARIGYNGLREPTLDVLRALQLAHTQTIPFENLDPLLDRPVAIDIPALETKLIRGRRGGYCFEQNRLFHAALTALGFAATLFGARVYLDRPPDAPVPARTHLAVRVELGEGAYLTDVGFGGQSPTGPLRLDTEAVQETPHEPYRILPAAGQPDHELFSLEAKVAGAWKLLYRFRTDAAPTIDMTVGNYYVATHPASIFKNTLMVARAASDGRHTLANNRLSFHRLGRETQKRRLADAPALIDALHEIFGIDVPDEAKLASAFQRLKSA